jgi:diguanylate cyclase (GGDEF)-like protein/PAS domain S-box-containing protein
MADWYSRIQDFVGGIAASVAVVGRDPSGALVVTSCNETFFAMTGGRGPGVDGFPTQFEALLPSYARQEFRAKIRECFDTGVAQELEQAYDLRDGTHWWRLSLEPLRHTDGGVTVFDILVTGLDITQKMDLTHELQAATARFRSVVDAAYDAIITIDQLHKITLFNRGAENLFGYDSSEMIGQPIEILIPEKFRAHHAEYIQRFAQSPVRSRQMNERGLIYGRHRDGTLLPVEIAISKINVNGLIEFTAVIRDIEDTVRLMDLLQKRAATDPLTGLPNRREFLDVTTNILKSNETLSVLMLDIDLFKKVNDTYGHEAGDEVLGVLAKAGAASCRKRDVFARWGGDEFVAALPETDLEGARTVAERLRSKVEAGDFVHPWQNGRAIPFTVSIGVTTRAPGEQDLEVIMKRADEALYKAKGTGQRNRVEVI